MAVTPYVVGQWVREERFYGRGELLREILEGNRDCLWILGTRRIGKTSLLKQVEHLTQREPARGYFPLFWDFQGSEEVEDLHESFRDSLFDAMDRLVELGIEIEAVEKEDLLASIGLLRRELRGRGLRLLLLGDEVEELVTIYEKDPRFLKRLRRTLQSPENIRTVFASTIRLWNLAGEDSSSSPFMHGFTPPLLVRGLLDEDARRLVRQSQLPAEARPAFDKATVEAIRERANNHPYLLQILAERTLELGDVEEATAEIAGDQMVSFFFGSDLAMLGGVERRILRALEEKDHLASHEIEGALGLERIWVDSALGRLESLGFVEKGKDGGYFLGSYFFRRWLRGQDSDLTEVAPGAESAETEPRDRSAATTRSRPRIDDRYELLARVGSGATGEVYKARDELLRSTVALKILRRGYSADEDALERLRREVVLSRDLSHPNLLKLYHMGEDAGRRYITMQYVEGPDLARVIAAETPMSIERVVVLAGKLAAGLAALHAGDVLHRDIKPSNVLLERGREPLITDFGLARLQQAPTVTRTGMFLGTPAYASPEQAVGEPLDERSDIYALGLVIFEMATGQLPFVSESIYELLTLRLQRTPPSPGQLRPELPAELSRIILGCLARERAHRFQKASELGAELEALRPSASA